MHTIYPVRMDEELIEMDGTFYKASPCECVPLHIHVPTCLHVIFLKCFYVMAGLNKHALQSKQTCVGKRYGTISDTPQYSGSKTMTWLSSLKKLDGDLLSENVNSSSPSQ